MNSIVAPFGKPIEERPAVPTLEERLESREAKRRAKEERRWARSGKEGLPWDSEGQRDEGRVEEVQAEGEKILA